MSMLTYTSFVLRVKVATGKTWAKVVDLWICQSLKVWMVTGRNEVVST